MLILQQIAGSSLGYANIYDKKLSLQLGALLKSCAKSVLYEILKPMKCCDILNRITFLKKIMLKNIMSYFYDLKLFLLSLNWDQGCE